MQHPLYLSNDDYRQFLIFFRLTVIVNLDYSVPGLVVADEKEKSKSYILAQDLNRSTHFKGTVLILLTTDDGRPTKTDQDRRNEKFTDYFSKLISIYKIIAESRLSLTIDFKMVSFLLKFGNRHFLLFQIVSYRFIIHVYSGIWEKKVSKY